MGVPCDNASTGGRSVDAMIIDVGICFEQLDDEVSKSLSYYTTA